MALATGPTGTATAGAVPAARPATVATAVAAPVNVAPIAARVTPPQRPASAPVGGSARVPAAPTADLPRNREVDDQGQLALPMPYLAASPTLSAHDDGTASLQFSIHYDVWIPLGDTSGRPDEAVLTVMVASTMNVNGPLKNSPTFVKVLVDGQLDEKSQIRDYTVELPADAFAFLKDKGWNPALSPTALADAAAAGDSGKGGDSGAASPAPAGPSAEQLAAQRAALQYLEINVSHVRDFKVVDGVFDWSQSRAWTGTDGPVTESITDSSTFTVINNTNQIGQTLAADGTTSAGGTNDFQAFTTTDDTLGVPIVLAGQPVQCIGQGDGSNPTGFQLTNGFDVFLDLPPGQLPVGASITQQVNADDSLGAQTLSGAQDLVTGTVQVVAAAASTTTPGLKSLLTGFALIADDLTGFGPILTVVLAIPFKAIGQLVRVLVNAATDSCADYANVFNLTAAEPSGATASYSWGDQTDGLFDVYAEATYGTAPTVVNNVAVSQSTGVTVQYVPSATNKGIAAVNPWLTQVAETGCGSSAHGLVNNTGSCGSSGNNVIGVTWSMNNPCPQTLFSDCQVTTQDTSTFPAVSVPGSDLCGPDNDLCPPLAAPIADGSDITTPFYLSGSDGDAFTVLREWNPTDQVNAIAAGSLATPGLGSEVFLGWQSGAVTVGQPQQDGSLQQETLAALPAPVTSMVLAGGLLFVGTEGGQLYSVNGQDVRTLYLTDSDGAIDHLAFDGTYLYFSSGTSFSSWDVASGSYSFRGAMSAPVTALAVSPTQLVIGTQTGGVARCPLGTSICDGLEFGTLTSEVQSVATSGEVAYAGLSDGSLVRLDLTADTSWVLQGPGARDSTTAGVTVVDGALYYGGCYGGENPVTGDMLGVVAIPEAPPSGQYQPFYPDPDAGVNDCSNISTNDDSIYKGFQADQYALTSAQPQPGFPSIVWVAFTIDSGNFVYALQNNLPPTPNLCYAQSSPNAGGNCPDYASTAPQPAAIPLPAPPTSLRGLAAPTSQTVSSNDLQCTGLTTVTPGAGSDGQPDLQIAVPSADGATCTTTVAWDLSPFGSLPYSWWSGTITATQLPDAESPAVTVSSGYGTGPVDATTPWSQTLVTTPLVGSDGLLASAPLPTVSAGGPLIPSSPVTGTGLHVTAGLISPSQVATPMLVLQFEVPTGGPGTFTITDDTLALTTSPPSPPAPPPVPTPLPGTTHCPAGLGVTPPSGSQIYPLDDPGSVVGDVGGGGRNGLAWNTSAFNSGTGPFAACPQSGGVGLNGTTSFVATPDPAPLATAGPSGTVVSWFQGGDTQGRNPRIVANDHPDVTDTGLQLFLDQSGASGAFEVGLGTGYAAAEWTSTTSVLDGGWHQYVGTWDNGTITAYLDGQPVATSTYAGTPVAGTAPLSFGYNPQYQGDYLTGTVAQVAVLPAALTADQVAQSFALGGQS